MKKKHWKRHILIIIFILVLMGYAAVKTGLISRVTDIEYDPEILEEAGEWKGFPFAYINDNVPEFGDDEIWTSPQESLEPLDSYGRCGTAMSCVGRTLTSLIPLRIPAVIPPKRSRALPPLYSSMRPTIWTESCT